jgi:DNA-3-methyladenine glycosylase II
VVILAARAQTFEIDQLGQFSLEAAARFWGGFTPAAHGGLDAQGHLHMAFPVEGSWTTAGVCVTQRLDGSVVAEVFSDGDGAVGIEAVKRQTARILSLDVDGRDFASIGERDPVAGELQRRFPGLRPVCFYSAYEAATWAVISHRINKHQAAGIKSRLSEAMGASVEIHGEVMRAFPAPSALLQLQEFPGLFGKKPEWLRTIAACALAGELDGAYLRSLPEDLALAKLRALPGIGPFGSELILLRGAGHPDYLTLLEPKFRTAVGEAYGMPSVPTDDDLRRISDNWRPYRMWQSFLLRQRNARK